MKRSDKVLNFLVALPFIVLFAAAFYAAFFWRR